MNPKRVLFIDRDGTLTREPDDYQLDSFDKLKFMPGMLCALARIAGELPYELVMVTNQDGLGTEAFPEETFWPVHNLLMRTLEGEGVRFADVIIDRTFPHEKAPTRKPGTALLEKYLSEEYDLEHSFVIGDRSTDMLLARNLGTCGIWLDNDDGQKGDEEYGDKEEMSGLEETVVLRTGDWQEIYRYLRAQQRRATVRRTTRETDITVELALDGSGKTNIHTGIGFFDHMLEQLGFHGSFDLRITAAGDLHVDEHHTVEDTALALGEAFRSALGDARGIARYAFTVPMDESRATAAVDVAGGRNYLVWKVAFHRERIGEMPTELFYHFFKSFTDTSRTTLHLEAYGDNEHHKAEALFKAFARALRKAVVQTGESDTSTKGAEQWEK
jgi:imidazoleglycerol-phosphate dehydratase/histidinol-phosphatase